MKEVYPEFADSVDFYAVGQDPSESLEKMERYRQEQGYPWPVAKTDTSTLRRLEVLQTSTKLAVSDRESFFIGPGMAAEIPKGGGQSSGSSPQVQRAKIS